MTRELTGRGYKKLAAGGVTMGKKNKPAKKCVLDNKKLGAALCLMPLLIIWLGFRISFISAYPQYGPLTESLLKYGGAILPYALLMLGLTVLHLRLMPNRFLCGFLVASSSYLAVESMIVMEGCGGYFDLVGYIMAFAAVPAAMAWGLAWYYRYCVPEEAVVMPDNSWLELMVRPASAASGSISTASIHGDSGSPWMPSVHDLEWEEQGAQRVLPAPQWKVMEEDQDVRLS